MQHATGAYVHHEIEHGIATVEFYHPSSNALPEAILSDLAKTINDIGIDARVKVIVLKSHGDRAFCAGASFDELVAIEDAAQGKKFFSGFANVINAMRKCHKLIIGRVQGKAVGGGVGLAAACDYVIAHQDSSVKLSELAIGIGPFVVGPAVERKMGRSAFSQLAIDATEWRSADWAKRHDLFNEVHDSMSGLDEAVHSLADKLAHSSPDAMWELKKIFWQGSEHWDTLLAERAVISGRLVLSDFTRNAIAKFKANAAKKRA
ncbi:MAG: enoyl-CoA hydratase/isomerase family protein [Chitinophagaceae bacterium]